MSELNDGLASKKDAEIARRDERDKALIKVKRIVARHYRVDVPVLLERVHALEALTPHPLTLEEFYRLPAWTIVAKTWPYQGENAEPEIWQRTGMGSYWAELTDTAHSHEERYAPDCAYSEGAIHVIVWQTEAGR